MFLPTAVAYDLVLEDHILSRQKVKRQQRPFSRELAEMVRFAVGYRSRAFVTFGRPISVDGFDPVVAAIDSRPGTADAGGRSARSTRCCRPRSWPRRCGRRSGGRSSSTASTRCSTRCASIGANLGVNSGRDAVAAAEEPFQTRGIIVIERRRFRVRERNVLRYYARSIAHLLSPGGPTH